MRPIPAPRIGESHGLLRAIEQRGRLRTDEFMTEFTLEQLFPPDLENALGRMRHFISFARSAGLVKEDRGVVELTDVGRRYMKAADAAALFEVSSLQAEWLRRQLREKHMTDSIFHGLAIGISLLASCTPGASVSTLDFGRSLAYLGRAGWDNENTLQIQGERYLFLLRDMEMTDVDGRLTGIGEQVRGELTLPVHMSLIDIAGQLNPGGPDAVLADAAAEAAARAPAVVEPPEPEPPAPAPEPEPEPEPEDEYEPDDDGGYEDVGPGAWATPEPEPATPPASPTPASPAGAADEYASPHATPAEPAAVVGESAGPPAASGVPGESAGPPAASGVPGESAGPPAASGLPGESAGPPAASGLPGESAGPPAASGVPGESAGPPAASGLPSESAGPPAASGVPGESAGPPAASGVPGESAGPPAASGVPGGVLASPHATPPEPAWAPTDAPGEPPAAAAEPGDGSAVVEPAASASGAAAAASPLGAPPVPPDDIWDTAAPDDATRPIAAVRPPLVPRAGGSAPAPPRPPSGLTPGDPLAASLADAPATITPSGSEAAPAPAPPAADELSPPVAAPGAAPPAVAGDVPAGAPPRTDPGAIGERAAHAPASPPAVAGLRPGEAAARAAASASPEAAAAAARAAGSVSPEAAAAAARAAGSVSPEAAAVAARAAGSVSPEAAAVAARAAGSVSPEAAAVAARAAGSVSPEAVAAAASRAAAVAPLSPVLASAAPGAVAAAVAAAGVPVPGAGRLAGEPGAFLDPAALRAAAEDAGLRLPAGVYANLAAALGAGKHVLLTGAPGAGKTTLALAVARAAAQAGRAHGATLVTAGHRWSDRDTIGRTGRDGEPGRPGVLVDSARRGRWVIVDELDRAQPDRALGSLSAFLSGLPVVLSTGEEAAPAADWRIVATWGGGVPRASAAVLRRFAVVEMPAPSAEALQHALEAAAPGDHVATGAVMRLLPLAALAPLGAGVFLDAARHAAARNAAAPTDEGTLAREVFAAYVAPLLGELDDEGERRVRELLGA